MTMVVTDGGGQWKFIGALVSDAEFSDNDYGYVINDQLTFSVLAESAIVALTPTSNASNSSGILLHFEGGQTAHAQRLSVTECTHLGTQQQQCFNVFNQVRYDFM